MAVPSGASASPVAAPRGTSRILLVALLLCAGLVAAVTWWDRQLRGHLENLTRLQRLGVHVELEPRGPRWQRALVGEQYFQQPLVVNCTGTSVTDEDLAILGAFPQMQDLCLFGARKVTDAGLAYLAPVRDLQRLNLVRTSVRGEGLRHLRELPNLRELHLGPEASDVTLEHVRELKSLRRVNMTSSSVTRAGLEKLLQMPHLAKVQLLNTIQFSEREIDELRQRAAARAEERRRAGDSSAAPVEIVFSVGL